VLSQVNLAPGRNGLEPAAAGRLPKLGTRKFAQVKKATLDVRTQWLALPPQSAETTPGTGPERRLPQSGQGVEHLISPNLDPRMGVVLFRRGDTGRDSGSATVSQALSL
jgi:hypothetical protein